MKVLAMLRLFGPRDRAKALGLVLMMLVATSLEVLSVGMVLPFLALMQDPGAIGGHPLTNRLLGFLAVESPERRLVVLGLAFGVLYILKNAFLTALYFLQYRFLYNTQLAISLRLFASHLRRPYASHLHENSATLIRDLNNEVVYVFQMVLVPGSIVLVEGCAIVAIFALLVSVEPVSALVTFAGLALAAGLFYRALRARLLASGLRQQRHSASMIKTVTEALGAMKETKILGCEQFFIDRYARSGRENARSLRFYRFAADTPRLIIEVFAVCGMLLGGLVVFLRHESVGMVLPVLGLFGMGAARIMPSLNRVLVSAGSISHFSASVDAVSRHLTARDAAAPNDAPRPGAGPAARETFARTIEVVAVSYRYPLAAADALRDVSLSIRRGTSVAFVGPSGAGKTTLADVILGLLTPTRGRVLVDGRDIHRDPRAWQRLIGYIPQAGFLADDSIRRNVAFGIDDPAIDDERVRRALRTAQLQSVLEALPDGLDTVIGERGIRLSGGQRQRIGIARALYHDPPVLVMDEAMSALDNETEASIGREIRTLSHDRTLIIVAHRLTTVQHCDTVFFLQEGRLAQADTYEGLLRNRDFKNMVEAGLFAAR